MKRYRCHKVVQAAKINEIVSVRDLQDRQQAERPYVSVTDFWLDLGEGCGVSVSSQWVHEKRAKSGGYYVIYDDGYESFSPAKAFEDGYTVIEDGQ